MEFLSVPVCILLFLFIHSVSSQNALTPPRGWNSYPSYSWTITQRQFINNVDEMYKRLRKYGFEYAVVDGFWFRSLEDGIDSIDEWGRPIPDPTRWRSSHNGIGFKQVADTVHTLGLKFGIQITGGISARAVDENTPVLDINTGKAFRDDRGRQWYARGIALRGKPCSYAPGFVAVDTTIIAGKVFLRSLYEMFASWGVDYVKLDCVFGDHFNIGEITAVSEILHGFPKPMIFSVSPGNGATTDMATQVASMVNMYRITANNWDQWEILKNQFDRAREFTLVGLVGEEGLLGNVWPDLDILPFGWLTDQDVKQGPHRKSNLTFTEQTTEMTLWSMARSPIMYGGDLKRLDLRTRLLITNPTLQELNYYSSNNREFPNSFGPGIRSWIATGRNGEIYVALFNLNEKPANLKLLLSDVQALIQDRTFSNCTGNDLWNGRNNVADGALSARVEPHASSLFVLTCT